MTGGGLLSCAGCGDRPVDERRRPAVRPAPAPGATVVPAGAGATAAAGGTEEGVPPINPGNVAFFTVLAEIDVGIKISDRPCKMLASFSGTKDGKSALKRFLDASDRERNEIINILFGGGGVRRNVSWKYKIIDRVGEGDGRWHTTTPVLFYNKERMDVLIKILKNLPNSMDTAQVEYPHGSISQEPGRANHGFTFDFDMDSLLDFAGKWIHGRTRNEELLISIMYGSTTECRGTIDKEVGGSEMHGERSAEELAQDSDDISSIPVMRHIHSELLSKLYQ
tara:strand:- start:107 stop:946 length:840 start_codon:yes stop_codon:yes gene_type:complete